MTDQEIVRAVAEKVMGWNDYLNQFYWPEGEEWNPLTNLNHAFMVVEKMREDGYTLKLGYGLTIQGVLAWVRFTNEPESSYYHDKQVGKAICLAALKAKGVEV